MALCRRERLSPFLPFGRNSLYPLRYFSRIICPAMAFIPYNLIVRANLSSLHQLQSQNHSHHQRSIRIPGAYPDSEEGRQVRLLPGSNKIQGIDPVFSVCQLLIPADILIPLRYCRLSSGYSETSSSIMAAKSVLKCILS